MWSLVAAKALQKTEIQETIYHRLLGIARVGKARGKRYKNKK